MTRTEAFRQHADHYDQWFEEHRSVYEAELRAVSSVLPRNGRGLEIGAGTGRFAVPLGVDIGLEPVDEMRENARKRGLSVLAGTAEHLPFLTGSFAYALMVTTVCFLDDLEGSFREAFRVLEGGGFLVVGFIDRDSPVGTLYQRHKHESLFYRQAEFRSSDEVLHAMDRAGFRDFVLRQTIFGGLSGVTESEPVEPGCGRGSFVVVRGSKG